MEGQHAEPLLENESVGNTPNTVYTVQLSRKPLPSPTRHPSIQPTTIKVCLIPFFPLTHTTTRPTRDRALDDCLFTFMSLWLTFSFCLYYRLHVFLSSPTSSCPTYQLTQSIHATRAAARWMVWERRKEPSASVLTLRLSPFNLYACSLSLVICSLVFGENGNGKWVSN